MSGSWDGIRQRLFRGARAQTISVAASSAIRVCEIPLFLYWWSPTQYGEWLILLSVAGIFSLADFGLVNTGYREMLVQTGRGRRIEALRTFQSVSVAVLILSLGAIFVLLSLASIVRVENYLGFSAMETKYLWLIVFCLAMQSLVSLQANLVCGALGCTGRYDIGISLATALYVFDFLSSVCALIFFQTPAAVALAVLCSRGCGTFAAYATLRRQVPWLWYGTRHAGWQKVRDILRPALASELLPLGNFLNFNGVRLALGWLLSPQAVVAFTAMRTLARLPTLIAESINRLTQPELAVALSRGDQATARNLFRGASSLNFWGAFVLIVLIAIGSDWIWANWVGMRLALEHVTLLALLFATLANCCWVNALGVPYSVNRHERAAWHFVSAYLVAVVAILAAGVGSSMLVPAAILAIAEVVLLFSILPVALRITGDSLPSYAIDVLLARSLRGAIGRPAFESK